MLHETCAAFPESWTTSVFPAQPRVIAIGDVHGDLDFLRRSLFLARVIDLEDNWIGGSTWVIQTGDQVDSCRKPECQLPGSSNTLNDMDVVHYMDLLAQKAQRSNGKVISLLGNHETWNMFGDMRYVGYASLKDFDWSWEERKAAWATRSKEIKDEKSKAKVNNVGTALACTRPAFVIVGSWLFGHAGINSKGLAQVLPLIRPEADARLRELIQNSYQVQGKLFEDPGSIFYYRNIAYIDALNQYIQKWLFRANQAGQTSSSSFSKINLLNDQIIDILFMDRELGTDVPVNASLSAAHFVMEEQMCATALQPVLSEFQLRGMVIGHSITNTRQITKVCNDRLIRIDIGGSSSFDGSPRPSVLEIGDDRNIFIRKELNNPYKTRKPEIPTSLLSITSIPPTFSPVSFSRMTTSPTTTTVSSTSADLSRPELKSQLTAPQLQSMSGPIASSELKGGQKRTRADHDENSKPDVKRRERLESSPLIAFSQISSEPSTTLLPSSSLSSTSALTSSLTSSSSSSLNAQSSTSSRFLQTNVLLPRI